jgi:muconolactone delta-isomerase
MAQYMVEVILPDFFDEHFVSLIPEQRAYVDTLMMEGVITGYSLQMDRTKLWVTFNAKSEAMVRKLVRSFPIIDYIDFSVTELAFHNQASFIVPSLSLN